MALDVTTFLTGLVGGSAGGAALTAGMTTRAERRKQREIRKGRARMLHEDLMHLQATLARTFYDGAATWWQDAWLLPLVTTEEDRQDLFAAMERTEYAAVGSALGWMEYLINGKNTNLPPPSDDEVVRIYERLAGARYALQRVGDLVYRPHKGAQMKPTTGGRADGKELPQIDAARAAELCARSPATENDAAHPQI